MRRLELLGLARPICLRQLLIQRRLVNGNRPDRRLVKHLILAFFIVRVLLERWIVTLTATLVVTLQTALVRLASHLLLDELLLNELIVKLVLLHGVLHAHAAIEPIVLLDLFFLRHEVTLLTLCALLVSRLALMMHLPLHIHVLLMLQELLMSLSPIWFLLRHD